MLEFLAGIISALWTLLSHMWYIKVVASEMVVALVVDVTFVARDLTSPT